MNRISQGYEGDIPELKCLSFCDVTALAENENVVLIWFISQEKHNYYRVFIDGYYCGIDHYRNSTLSDDMDGGIQLISYTPFFSQKSVTQAYVTYDEHI